MLYLIATPIGNLTDITQRAIDTLRACDYILCEDTRHSSILLSHLGIKKPLKSYHKFNESKELEKILSDLKNGLHIALISDAGTPTIADPGEELVAQCKSAGLAVTTLPGPCAAIAALTLSGFATSKFQFVGFLPKTTQELKKTLLSALFYEGTTICYETPHRIPKTLSLLATLDKQRKLCLVRELTKIHEESLTKDAHSLLEHVQKAPPKGEIVLLISGSDQNSAARDLDPRKFVSNLQEMYGLPLPEAIKMAAALQGIGKREVYHAVHKTPT